MAGSAEHEDIAQIAFDKAELSGKALYPDGTWGDPGG